MLNLNEVGRGCARGMLLGLNGLCILVSICTFGFAIVDARILKQYGDAEAVGTFAGDMFIVAACVLLLIVASVGCAGAVTSNVKVIYLYVGFLMILVILELLIAIFVSVKRYGLEFRVTNWIRDDFFKNVTGDELADHKRMWDDLQTTYECCGLNGPEDYPAIHESISVSCCPRAYRARTEYAQRQLYKSCIDTMGYYTEGCEEEVLFAIREGADCLLGVAVITFWFEAAGMLLAMWMANNLKNEVKVYKEVVKY